MVEQKKQKSEGGPPAPRKVVKVLLVKPVTYFRRPLAEQGEVVGELNFKHHEKLKQADTSLSEHGLQVTNLGIMYDFIVPWSNIVAIYYDGRGE